MKAFIFPGQGSQKVGMGADLADASAAARETFEQVDDALNQKLFTLMREGPDAELTLTSNAQPAIMANAIATLRVLEKDFGVKLKDAATCVAGHSLGEYTALCAVNAFALGDTAKLLRLRGIAMQDAVPIGVGGMAALLGSDIETAQKLAEEGHIRLNGRRIDRAHAPVRAGDLITFPHIESVRVVRVLALPVRRGPAPEAQSCYEELTIGS